MSYPHLSQAIEGYLIHKAARRLSAFTLRNYRGDLERFTQWLHDPPIDTVTSRQIERYFQYLSENFTFDKIGSHELQKPRPLSAKTIQNAWGTLSNFWKWIEIEFGIDNPFKVPRIKANTKPIDPISQDVVQRLLKICDTAVKVNQTEYVSKRPTARRDKAIVLLLLDTGIRASELCNITVGNVDFHSNRILVTGKGDKSRYVYFGKICSKALWHYFAERFPGGDAKNNEPFFVQGDGIHTLNRGSLRLLVGRLGKKAGNDNLHPHRFRHTFAIQFLRNGGNIFELQALLGHATLDMVQHYARLAEMDLESAAQRSSPADNWRL